MSSADMAKEFSCRCLKDLGQSHCSFQNVKHANITTRNNPITVSDDVQSKSKSK